ncbi:hypothetical protein GF340_01340 [Candidatus Peregrinibacteria bacterium]|nr:hypothetical protein [Candidatus Peregrinibacteria bacterium]
MGEKSGMCAEKLLPVEEMVAYEEFTDRVEILRDLGAWVKNIQRMASPSIALISPRRMGKTVLLDRLVNTVFLQPEYQVAPFYFKMKREKTTLHQFLLRYATTFFRQYIAYCAQDLSLYKDSQVNLRALLDFPSEHPAAALAQQDIQVFLQRYEDNTWEDARNHWDDFICVPELLGSRSGIRVAVIIDEFQDMKFYVYDASPDHFVEMKTKGLLTDTGATNLTATYDRQAQSRKAPMLVSGSAVTMIFRTVMGGPLGGRFGFKYLKPLSIPDGATLLHQVLRLYAPDMRITPELALYASEQVGGHPYYVYCLSISDCDDKSFDDQTSIDRLIRYEIERGKIYGFWQTHFEDNRRYINADNDVELGKKIIYYFTQYNNQPVDIKAIAAKLNVSKDVVQEKIERLYLADLVYRSAARYYTFNDICLMRFIKFVYEQDLEGIEEVDLSQRHLFNTLKGKFLEIVVQVTMMKFNHEVLDGAWFGKSGKIEAPLFQVVNAKTVKGSKTGTYQIDVYGKEQGAYRVWLCECKYTTTKMGMARVEKLEQAAAAFTQEEADAGRPVPTAQLWLVSTGGFTKEVRDYAASREDIYASGHDEINAIFQAYGGSYRIPIFTQA